MYKLPDGNKFGRLLKRESRNNIASELAGA
jgi:hypothetical protein